ncbi:hypothetical protein MB02_08335 [Croceicoccus estronivorus]|uniref:alpha/beta hydrolase n=1 Tax=Croceicoccus estronivorus TaxID=1172626 RepID=UPI00082FCC92|nr:alpha/beta hydrolase [Croceicoccus estronivorus]OCC23832.1 hypothetical protein MB02_08335 [Croceicoccus estronivorus]
MALDMVDPELREPLAQFPDIDFQTIPLDAMRSQPSLFVPLEPPAPQPVERMIPGLDGQPDVKVIVVDPNPGATDRPAYLHIHGGGYVMGSVDQMSAGVQATAMATGIPVVSVEYRLAPETRFDGSLADNYAALVWLAGEGGKELGVDPARIAVGGESAGGGHSAMLAIAARDQGGPRIAFQLLTYPMLDDRSGSSRAVADHLGEFVWTASSNRFGWESLLGQPAGADTLPEGSIVPSRVDDLSNLPPAWIGCGALDLFIEEDLDYAKRLIAAGVPAEVTVIPGAYHGFDGFVPTAGVSQKFAAARLSALKRGLGLPE